MDIAKYAVHVSERRPEKNTSRGKTLQEIWEGSTAHSLKSLSYEGLKALRLEGLDLHLPSTYSNIAR